MKVISKSRAPITLDVSENGEIIAQDIYDHPVPLRISEALKARFENCAPPPPKRLALGAALPDGSVYAGISPDTGKVFYATAHDEPDFLSWDAARHRAASKDAHGHKDWRVPTLGELNVLFNNRAAIGGFNLSDWVPAGWYWSSSEGYLNYARHQRFSDGVQDSSHKSYGMSVRCVRR